MVNLAAVFPDTSVGSSQESVTVLARQRTTVKGFLCLGVTGECSEKNVYYISKTP